TLIGRQALAMPPAERQGDLLSGATGDTAAMTPQVGQRRAVDPVGVKVEDFDALRPGGLGGLQNRGVKGNRPSRAPQEVLTAVPALLKNMVGPHFAHHTPTQAD